MLSRVAENAYWMARYLERAEDTARLVNTTTQLLLDLPRSVPLNWVSLVDILSSGSEFRRAGHNPDERGVMRFLLSDPQHGSSILASIDQARENARTTRDVLPAAVWESLNELYLFAKENLAAAVASRRKRYDVLRSIMRLSLEVAGLIDGTLSRGDLFHILTLGQKLERADMTTRILDVRAVNLLPEPDLVGPYANLAWMSVLTSLNAYHMYRNQVQARIAPEGVVRFLLQDRLFPRACLHCTDQLAVCLGHLPRPQSVLDTVETLRDRLQDAPVAALDLPALHAFIDDVQLDLGRVHQAISSTYFRHGAT